MAPPNKRAICIERRLGVGINRHPNNICVGLSAMNWEPYSTSPPLRVATGAGAQHDVFLCCPLCSSRSCSTRARSGIYQRARLQRVARLRPSRALPWRLPGPSPPSGSLPVWSTPHRPLRPFQLPPTPALTAVALCLQVAAAGTDAGAEEERSGGGQRGRGGEKWRGAEEGTSSLRVATVANKRRRG